MKLDSKVPPGPIQPMQAVGLAITTDGFSIFVDAIASIGASL